MRVEDKGNRRMERGREKEREREKELKNRTIMHIEN